jgi:hypothetical protein
MLANARETTDANSAVLDRDQRGERLTMASNPLLSPEHATLQSLHWQALQVGSGEICRSFRVNTGLLAALPRLFSGIPPTQLVDRHTQPTCGAARGFLGIPPTQLVDRSYSAYLRRCPRLVFGIPPTQLVDFSYSAYIKRWAKPGPNPGDAYCFRGGIPQALPGRV